MDVAAMRAECARCAALCCVALAFYRSDSFAIDKANGEPCPHLSIAGRCGIYTVRAEQGFPGCVDYDCLGAGQRVTQELFGGRSWLEDPSLLAPMTRAFVAMRQIHELRVLLDTAKRAPLSDQDRAALAGFEAELEPADGWSSTSLSAFDDEDLSTRIRTFLASLRGYLKQEPGV
jgi:hypothetical protein